jgi:hypothetical protein
VDGAIGMVAIVCLAGLYIGKHGTHKARPVQTHVEEDVPCVHTRHAVTPWHLHRDRRTERERERERERDRERE